MSLLVCPYCRGLKFNRHDKPPEISQEFWDKLAGPLNLCLLCKGHGRVGQDVFNEAGELGLVVLRTATTPPKILISCAEKDCRKFYDATAFFSRAKAAQARCPDGHCLELGVID